LTRSSTLCFPESHILNHRIIVASFEEKCIDPLIHGQNGVKFWGNIGIIATENDKQVTIRKMGGTDVTIARSEIKQLYSQGTSLMMEGLEGSISPQQMADLLTFLQQGTNEKYRQSNIL